MNHSQISIITENMEVEIIKETNLTGKEIAELIYKWVDKKSIHPDDFDMMFAHELIEKLEEDERV